MNETPNGKYLIYHCRPNCAGSLHTGYREICKTEKILHFLKYILVKILSFISFCGVKLQSSSLGIVGA